MVIEKILIKNIRHTGIVVDDLDISLEFYCDNLGFVVAKRVDESGSFISAILGMDDITVTTVKMVLNDGPMIELLDFKSHKKERVMRTINDIGPTHIAFTVDNLNQVYRDFSRNGVVFISSPEISPDGYAKVAFCKAPEGTYIELVELL